jgi:hypothetical protein
MRKPLTAALLLGGHLLLTFSPMAATAASASPAPAADSHYRCMYRCAERGYGDHGGYRHDGYGDHGGYRHDGYGHDGYGHDGYRHDHYRDGGYYRDGECWYHDDWGWHHCGYRHRW